MKNMIYRAMAALAIVAAAFTGCTGDVIEPIEKDYDAAYIEELSKYGEVVMADFAPSMSAEQDEHGNALSDTRAPLNVDETANSFYNAYVFQFKDPNDTSGEILVAPPYFISEAKIAAYKANGTPIQVPLLSSTTSLGAQTYQIVVCANINDTNFNFGARMSSPSTLLSTLLQKALILENETASYGGDKKNLVMSSYTTGQTVTAGYTIPAVFTRSLAKVVLNLTVPAGYKVWSVQMKNVSNELTIFDYARRQYPSAPAAISNTGIYPVLAPATVDYAKVSGSPLINGSGNQTFVWYVPRNARGTNAAATVTTKNLYAPVGATYFEIYASGTADDSQVVFTIYPGKDATDFNLLPNHTYTTNLTVNGDGSNAAGDTRVEYLGSKKLDGYNNSFILNPPHHGYRDYLIPISQVNRYWKPVYEGYGGKNDNMIASTTDWQVDVLWQNPSTVVRPAGTAGSFVTIEKYTGTGVHHNNIADWTGSTPTAMDNTYNTGAIVSTDDGYFRVRVPAGATPGNFVVVIRQGTTGGGTLVDNVLWSWHFWVTDYNPGAAIEHQYYKGIDQHKFVYAVPGGQVERWGGKLWGYTGFTGGTSYIPTVTNYILDSNRTPSQAQPYSQSFIMDRALGAIEWPESWTDRNHQLFYQWGRKDPIKIAQYAYNINGTLIPTTETAGFSAQKYGAIDPYNSTHFIYMSSYRASSGGLDIGESIAHPMEFLTVSDPSAGATYDIGGDWSGLNTTTYLWNDSNITPANQHRVDGSKSIYDPCPPGWQVPVYGIYEDFITDNPHPTFGWVRDAGVRMPRKNQTGTQYWPYLRKNNRYPVEGEIWFGSANRIALTGNDWVGWDGFWGNFAEPYNAIKAYCAWGTSGGSYNHLNDGVSYAKACAFIMRCISTPPQP